MWHTILKAVSSLLGHEDFINEDDEDAGEDIGGPGEPIQHKLFRCDCHGRISSFEAGSATPTGTTAHSTECFVTFETVLLSAADRIDSRAVALLQALLFVQDSAVGEELLLLGMTIRVMGITTAAAMIRRTVMTSSKNAQPGMPQHLRDRG